MILVVGASGFLGGEICRRLAAEGRQVRGLVRTTSDPSMVERIKSAGTEIVEGDLRDAASLERAVLGADTVISTATVTRSRQPGETIETTDLEGQLNLVDTARKAGVRRFVYVSYSGQIGTDDPLTTAKRTVERRVAESGMAYTILRPSVFMESWLSPTFGFDYPNARVTVFGTGETRISWISLYDVAAMAVRVLDDEAAANTIELGGPEALSPHEVVRLFERISGRRFEVQHVSVEMLKAQQAAAADSMERAFAALMLAFAEGNEIPPHPLVRRYGLRLTSVEEYARSVVGKTSAETAAARPVAREGSGAERAAPPA